MKKSGKDYGFKYHRILHIYTRLMSGEVIYTGALAEYFGVNEKWICQDLHDLGLFLEDQRRQGFEGGTIAYCQEEGGYRLNREKR